MEHVSTHDISSYKQIATINAEHGIYLVQDTVTGKIYVKKILETYNVNVYRALKEHPVAGMPMIYAIEETDGLLTVIEEHVSGNTIEELIEQGKVFSEAETIFFTKKLCDILNVLHSFVPPIIHRDIKPSNVMISPDGKLFLLDFNAARPDVPKFEDTKLLGTKGYAAPEQYGFGSSSVCTDIYAVGMLVNTMLWGSFNNEIHPGTLADIIRKCTELNPRDRFQSSAELKKALTSALAATGRKASAVSKWVPPGFRRGNIVCMIIASAFYLFTAWLALTINLDRTGFLLYYERIAFLISIYMVPACIFNYGNIRVLMPLCKNKSMLIRVLGVVLLIAMIDSLLLCSMIFMEMALLG